MTLTLLNIPILFGFSIEVYITLFLIAIPTFFFWRWLLKKYIKVDRKRKIAVWCATLITTLLIYLVLFQLLLFSLTYTPSRDFDRKLWSSNKENRFQMAGNIIKSKILIGKDTSQVKQMLGEPTWINARTQNWTYDMGIGGGGLGFLFHNLDLKLDNKGKVTSVEHIEIPD